MQWQSVYKSSLTNFQEISSIHCFKHTRFVRDKPYNIRMQVKFVTSINEHVMMSSDRRSSLRHTTRLLIYEQQTWGLPYVQCSKYRLTRKNYTANDKFSSGIENKIPGYFQEEFQIPGVVDTLSGVPWHTQWTMTDRSIVSSTITTAAAMKVTNNQSLTTKRDRQTEWQCQWTSRN